MGEMTGRLWERAQNAWTGANRDPAYADAGQLSLRDFNDANGGNLDARNAQVLASLLASDEAGFIDIMREHAPEIEVTTDSNGRNLIAMPGQPPKYINEPGMSAADVGGIVRDIATFFPAARVASLGRAALTRIGAGALGEGGTSLARDAVAGQAGSDQGLNYGNAALAAGFGGGAMGLFPGFRKTGSGHHGTDSLPFSNFSRRRGTNDESQQMLGPGFYLASEPGLAQTYGRRTLDFDYDIRNPYRIETPRGIETIRDDTYGYFKDGIAGRTPAKAREMMESWDFPMEWLGPDGMALTDEGVRQVRHFGRTSMDGGMRIDGDFIYGPENVQREGGSYWARQEMQRRFGPELGVNADGYIPEANGNWRPFGGSEDQSAIIDLLRKRGHDGVMVDYTASGYPGQEIMAFDPHQLRRTGQVIPPILPDRSALTGSTAAAASQRREQ